MSSTDDALVVGRRLVGDLVAAAEKGDDAAAGALVDLASHATNAVRSFYGSPNLDIGWIVEQMSREERPTPKPLPYIGQPLPPSDPIGFIDEPQLTYAENNRRREVIRQIARKRQDFPVLKSYYYRHEPDSKLWIKDIELGKELPWKNKRIEERDQLFHFITRVIYPEFETIRETPPVICTILEGDIRSLGPLCKATAPKWAPHMASWAVLNGFDLRPGSHWHELANPKRALAHKKHTAQKRLNKKFPRKLDSRIYWKEMTEMQVWQTEIDDMKLTDADLQNGLAEEIAKRLKSILKK